MFCLKCVIEKRRIIRERECGIRSVKEVRTHLDCIEKYHRRQSWIILLLQLLLQVIIIIFPLVHLIRWLHSESRFPPS